MKKLLKRTGVITVVLLLITATTAIAFASSGEKDSASDSSGNLLSSETSDNISCEKDFYWAGDSLQSYKTSIGYDAIMAGRDLLLMDGQVKGSVRAAGQTLTFDGLRVERNITVAGQDIKFLNSTSAQSIYAAGSDVTFDGKCTCLNVAAAKVTINGVIDGDVSISADKVEIGESAVITGTLKGTVGAEPKVANGAKIANTELDIETSDNNSSSGISLAKLYLGYKIFKVLATLLLGVLMCLIFKKPLASACDMVRRKPVALPITGLVSIIVAPIVFSIIMVTVVGIPISLLLFALYGLILLTSTAFTGGFLGQLVMPRMNRWGSTMIGVAVFAIAAAIPVVGFIVKLAAAIYSLGYFIQIVYEQLKTKKPAVQQSEPVTYVQVDLDGDK